jgi:DNA-binding IclR family transcriptional regulator
MRVVKEAVDRGLQCIELLAREACRIRMPYIGAELEPQTGPAHRVRGGLGKAAASVCAPKAIPSIGQLIPESELIRQRGYGLVVEEAEPGVAALAVAVRSLTDDTVVATTSIAGPVMRVQPERYDDFYALLKEAASKLGSVWPRQSVGANVSEAA